jgi:hypothetical protein
MILIWMLPTVALKMTFSMLLIILSRFSIRILACLRLAVNSLEVLLITFAHCLHSPFLEHQNRHAFHLWRIDCCSGFLLDDVSLQINEISVYLNALDQGSSILLFQSWQKLNLIKRFSTKKLQWYSLSSHFIKIYKKWKIHNKCARWMILKLSPEW